MEVIYKYSLDFDSNGLAEIEVPERSAILKTGVQQDKIVLWYFIADKDEPKHSEKFKVFMTGEEFELGSMEYIDTVTLKGWLVCHLFLVL